jgi:hypothetical protein
VATSRRPFGRSNTVARNPEDRFHLGLGHALGDELEVGSVDAVVVRGKYRASMPICGFPLINRK